MHIQTLTSANCRTRSSGVSTSRRQGHIPASAKTMLLLSVLCAGLIGCAENMQTVSSDRVAYETDMSDLDGLAINIPGM